MTDHKYRVIKRLEAGGMAEVFIGEAEGVQGFKKRVAIKRVLPHLAQNESFIEMFLDEARLSAKLDHANIVSVFDISAREDTYFLIMEFVDGANLKRIMDYLQSQGRRWPLGDAAFVCMEACRGLSYAHELADDEGKPLGIVHRDISPPNILLTKRGEVKVADFGLAKAGTQISQTDPGVVKGKFSYLSPEAAMGKEVDARADVFSLGIVLWEMLAGRRLFLGENDYATVKLIQKTNVPRLSPLNSEVDEAFEEVLLRALTQDPDHRYQSARELGDALAGYLFDRQLKVTSYDIASLVTAATSKAPAPTAPAQEHSLIDRLIQEELDASVAIDESAVDQVANAGDSDSGMMLGDLEDPASWFSEDELAAAAAKPSLTPRAEDDTGRTTSGSWRESGIEELDGLLESIAPSEAPPADEVAESGLGAPKLDLAGTGKAARPKRSGSGRLLAAIAVVAAVIVGALVVVFGGKP